MNKELFLNQIELLQAIIDSIKFSNDDELENIRMAIIGIVETIKQTAKYD